MAHQTSKISFFVARVNRISVLRISFTLVDGLELPLSVMLLNCIFILPLTVPTLVAKTLVVLTVYSDCITYVTTKECLPGLKSSLFQLFGRTLIPLLPRGNLFSCCPVLEELTIDLTLRLHDVLNFNISAPLLKTLRISLSLDQVLD
ncbi:unnamed protein product [Malus baccata var. baccata]